MALPPQQLSLFGPDDAPSPAPIINVASVPQRSLFRYPGGKTWFVPYFRRWLASLPTRPQRLIEPFAGGGIVGLTAAFERLTDRVMLVERDPQIAAVWQTLLSDDAEWLAETIQQFQISEQTVSRVLEAAPSSRREIAFQTILKNRVNHGGILAPGAGRIKIGEKGRGLALRWYPATLAKRIRDLEHVRHRVSFIEGDGIAVLRDNADAEDAVFFIDPPYTAGGKRAGSRLYAYSELDHAALFRVVQTLRGPFLMTYDNAEDVHRLADAAGFQARPIAMKNTHHARMSELIIGRDLDWL